MVRRWRAEWQRASEVRSLVWGSWIPQSAWVPCHGAAGVLTWWTISFSTSMGRSSSRSGPSRAFSFPLSDEPLVRWLSGSWHKAGDAGAGSSPSEGGGEHVLGEPGDEGGEKAMASRDGHVSPGRGDMNAHREERGRVRRAGDGGQHTAEAESARCVVFGGETCGPLLKWTRAAESSQCSPATARIGRTQFSAAQYPSSDPPIQTSR
jgi:hypothetical protein